MGFPNLFIVGAPRCGTTSFHDYLGQHPDIFMCEPKEPYYFLTDMPHRDRFDEKAYFALFADSGNVKYAGEASVWYLYSRAAADEIKRFCPSARIIIMLRNPIDLLYSLHGISLRTANEDILDFAKALEADLDRRQGRRIPATAFFPDGLFYRKVVDFTLQVQRYFDAFGRDAVRIITFDDFVRDTAAEYRRTLAWLGVAEDFEAELSAKNLSSALPNLAIQQLLRWNAAMRAFRAAMHKVVPYRIIRRVQAAIGNRTQEQRPGQADPELRACLQRQMLPQIEALSSLIDRDVTHWCRLS